MLELKNLKTEYSFNPIGVPLRNLRFSWNAESDGKNQTQIDYRVIVTDGKSVVWDSGKVKSQSTQAVLIDCELKQKTKYFWRVEISSSSGEKALSSEQTFETCLSDSEWESYPFITANTKNLPVLRKEFSLDKRVASARVFVCGLGTYELFLNGERVSCDLLNPLVTRYHDRYLYNIYDATTLFAVGKNAFAIRLGNGYYSMNENGVDWQKGNWANSPWADKPKCKLIAILVFEDGSERVICTDESWKFTESSLLVDEAYYGEEIDYRVLRSDWKTVGFDDTNWQNAVIANPPQGKAEPQLAESCAAVKDLPLKQIYCKGDEYLFDCCKTAVGWAQLKVSGSSGSLVEVSYSEWLSSSGELDDKGLLSKWNFKGRMRSGQTDYFILDDCENRLIAPYFQYKGFRYIRVRLYGGAKLNGATVKVVRTNLKESGEFSCSDEDINLIHLACKRTLLNNLHSYPSDTPVYENLGYLADGYLTQITAHYNFDAVKFYEKWNRDVLDQAKDSGYIEQTAPMWDEDKENAPEWSVAIAVVPYQIYSMTGDTTLLFESYEKAKKVFYYQLSQTQNFIANSQWGDHLSSNGSNINQISATSALYNMAKILAETANMKGCASEHKEFLNYANSIKTAFNAKFFNAQKGFYCQSPNDGFALNAQVIPYGVGLVGEDQKQTVIKSVQNFATDLCGGIFCVKYLSTVFKEFGLEDRLFSWVKSKKPPSWGYWLTFGDQSLWEQWTDCTRSRQHHMFGTIDEWFFSSLAGLQVFGAKDLKISPYFAKDLSWAKASVSTANGVAKCGWRRQGQSVVVNLSIPFNSRAEVNLPTENLAKVYLWGEPISIAKDIFNFKTQPTSLSFEVGSGDYEFIIK